MGCVDLTQKQKKSTTFVKIDKEVLREAKRLKLNIPALAEEALKGAIANIESYPSGGLTTVAGVERERKRVSTVSQAFSLYMGYNHPGTGYRIGIFGMNIDELKAFLYSTQSIDTITDDLEEWKSFLSWIKEFDPDAIITAWKADHSWAKGHQSDYDLKEKTFINETFTESKILLEAVDFITEVFPLYKKRLQRFEDEKLERERLKQLDLKKMFQ
jgi:hypothetical protein